MMKTIYMEMPKVGDLVTGVFASGSTVPNDRDNEVWRDYQTFLKAGGQPLPFDPAMEWVNGAWVINSSKKTAQMKSELERARLAALATVEQLHAETVQKLLAHPTQTEQKTWPLKLETAQAITNSTPISSDGFAFLAASDMSTPETAAWAAAVLVRSDEYAQVVGLAEKQRYAAREAVKAAADETSIRAAIDAQRAASNEAIALWAHKS